MRFIDRFGCVSISGYSTRPLPLYIYIEGLSHCPPLSHVAIQLWWWARAVFFSSLFWRLSAYLYRYTHSGLSVTGMGTSREGWECGEIPGVIIVSRLLINLSSRTYHSISCHNTLQHTPTQITLNTSLSISARCHWRPLNRCTIPLPTRKSLTTPGRHSCQMDTRMCILDMISASLPLQWHTNYTVSAHYETPSSSRTKTPSSRPWDTRNTAWTT